MKREHESDDALAFRTFALFWAIYALFHHGDIGFAKTPLDALENVAAVLVLFRPSSLVLFLLLHLFQLADFYGSMPNIPNHAVINVVASVTILVVAARRWWRAGRVPVTGGEVYRGFAPVVRVELLVGYGIAVFHKLNADFFYYPVSAATEHYLRLGERFRGVLGFDLFPTADWAQIAAVGATIACEASVPTLLLFRRTRHLGIAVALLFHYVVGLDEFYDFSAQLYALLVLFLPDGYLRTVADRWRGSGIRRHLGGERERARWLHPALGVALVLIAGVVWMRYHWSGLEQTSHTAWAVFGLAVCAVYVVGLREIRRLPVPPGAFRFESRAFLVFPLLVALNGMTPYLGLKTRSCFAMFSNVRTELRWEGDRSNHFLMPSNLKIAGFQEDLVQVLESSDGELAALADRGDYRTFFELRRYVSRRAREGARDLRIVYLRGGERHTVENAETHPVLSRPHPYLANKFLHFGDVSSGEHQRNRH